MIIKSERLELVPFSLEVLRNLLAGDAVGASKLFGATIVGDLTTSPSLLRLRNGQLEADPAAAPWLLRAVLLRTTGEMIGRIGFHAGPSPDPRLPGRPQTAELGYSIIPAFRRQGFASEAAMALMNWAEAEHGIRRFIVSVSPMNTPSLAMAAKLGFKKFGEQMDEIDGLEYVFIRNLEAGV